MIEISVKHDIDRLARWARFIAEDQLPFAAAVALTRTAQDAARELGDVLARYIDKPTPFTQRAWSMLRASKRDLKAVVFAKDAQDKYLRWQVHGGDRAPANKAQKLPSQIRLNEFGNIPRGEIARLVAAAKAGKRLTKARASRLGVSSKVDLFYGDPGDGMPPGVYKRVVQGERHVLIPMVVFPRRTVHYEPRLPMARVVQGVVQRRFDGHLHDAWRDALASARRAT